MTGVRFPLPAPRKKEMKADLHIHTSFSDGAHSPKKIVETALEKGIDCICITDHQETKGAIEALRFGFDQNILIIPGIEITTKAGDVLGINIRKVIPNNLSLRETAREIRKQGGMAVIAHPFDWPLMKFKGKKEDFLQIEAMEVFNARVPKILNKRAFNFSQKHNLALTAGSDAHRARFVGRAYVETQKKILSAKDLIREIMERRVKIKGKNLKPREMILNASIRGIPFFWRDFCSIWRNQPPDFL